MEVGVDGDLQLGADAIVCGHEDRVLEACGLQVEEAAETADLAVGAGAARRADGGLDLLHEKIAGVDIHACVAIGEAVLARLGHGALRS